MTFSDHLRSRSALLTKREAADLLGVSAKTIHRRISSGSLRSVRISARAVRIDPSDLARFVRSRQIGGFADISTTASLEQEA